MKQRFARLTRNLTLFNTAISAAILLLTGIVALSFIQEQISRREEADFRDARSEIIMYVDNELVINHEYLRSVERTHNMAIYIEDNDRPLLWTGEIALPDTRTALIALALEHAEIYKLTPEYVQLSSRGMDFSIQSGKNIYRASVWILVHGGNHQRVIVVQDTSEELALLREIAITLLIIIAGALLLFTLSSYFFARRAARPVLEAHRRQTEFVQAASHELRTPLAVMQASAEALPKADGEQRERFLAAIQSETRMMARLVDDMLLLASSDADALPYVHMPVEPTELLQDIARETAPLAHAAGKSLETAMPPSLPLISGDALRIKQAVRVLIDNALEYAPEGSAVHFRAQNTLHGLCIEVADNGPGIPDEHKADVFQRFYRLDKARSRQKAHYGLGLSIAREIARRHGGTLTVRDNTPTGAIFMLCLPAA